MTRGGAGVTAVCDTQPRAIVVMGVSGTGKTTLGHAMAEALGYHFIEGDALHAPESIAKMAAGVPLTDADRWPWLDRVAHALDEAAAAGGGVVTCSALKRSYRDRLRGGVAAAVVFIYPELPADQLRARLVQRRDHYMSVALLDSQLATFEPLQPDETAITVDATRPTADQVDELRHALCHLSAHSAAATLR